MRSFDNRTRFRSIGAARKAMDGWPSIVSWVI